MYPPCRCVVRGPAVSVGDLRRSGPTPAPSPVSGPRQVYVRPVAGRRHQQGCDSSNQVTDCPPRRRRQPHRVARSATRWSPRPPSASRPAGRSSGVSGPARSVTSTRTMPSPAMTVTVTASGSTRSAVPDTVAEDLADQQDSRVSAGVPGAEYLRDECAGGPRPFRPSGKRHALPDRPPSHHRTRPSPAAPPRETGRAAGGRRKCTLSSAPNVKPYTGLRGPPSVDSSVPAAPVRGLVPCLRPLSVDVRAKPTVPRTVPRLRFSSAMRPWTPQHRGLQRDTLTHGGTNENGPPAREFAASGAFSQRVAGVGFEPT